MLWITITKEKRMKNVIVSWVKCVKRLKRFNSKNKRDKSVQRSWSGCKATDLKNEREILWKEKEFLLEIPRVSSTQ